MKYKVGQKLYCRYNFYMTSPKGFIAFNTGKTYTIKGIDSESKYPYILDSNIDHSHFMNEELIDEFFVLDREEKLNYYFRDIRENRGNKLDRILYNGF